MRGVVLRGKRLVYLLVPSLLLFASGLGFSESPDHNRTSDGTSRREADPAEPSVRVRAFALKIEKDARQLQAKVNDLKNAATAEAKLAAARALLEFIGAAGVALLKNEQGPNRDKIIEELGFDRDGQTADITAVFNALSAQATAQQGQGTPGLTPGTGSTPPTGSTPGPTQGPNPEILTPGQDPTGVPGGVADPSGGGNFGDQRAFPDLGERNIDDLAERLRENQDRANRQNKNNRRGGGGGGGGGDDGGESQGQFPPLGGGAGGGEGRKLDPIKPPELPKLSEAPKLAIPEPPKESLNPEFVKSLTFNPGNGGSMWGGSSVNDILDLGERRFDKKINALMTTQTKQMATITQPPAQTTVSRLQDMESMKFSPLAGRLRQAGGIRTKSGGGPRAPRQGQGPSFGYARSNESALGMRSVTRGRRSIR